MIIAITLYSVDIKASPSPELKGGETEIKGILKTVSPSIVKVIFESNKRNFSSGIAVDRNYVLSSIFITQFPFDEIYIQTTDGRSFPAELVGKDPESRLILLSIKEKALTPFVRSNKLETGDWAGLVGAFYQKFPSVFQGIVSSASEDELLLNAPVVPGSAGGAVVNRKGELLGIILGRFGFSLSPDYTFKDSSGEIHIQSVKSKQEGLCYAIPATRAFRIADDLKQYGKVRRGWLGILMSTGKNGVVVQDVIADSPARKADLRQYDEITKMNGKIVRNAEDVIRIIRSTKPDQKIKFDLIRGNNKKSAFVTIEEARDMRPPALVPPFEFSIEPPAVPDFTSSLPATEDYVVHYSGPRTLGMDVVALTPELAKELNVNEGGGLMISKIYPNSPAEKAGFKVSDVIVKAANNSIKIPNDFYNVLLKLADNQYLDIRVRRNGKLEQIKVLPDKNPDFDTILNNFRDKLKELETYRKQQEIEAQRGSGKTVKTSAPPASSTDPKQQKELEKYKKEVERLRQEQLLMKKKIEEMMRKMEENKKKEKEKGKE